LSRNGDPVPRIRQRSEQGAILDACFAQSPCGYTHHSIIVFPEALKQGWNRGKGRRPIAPYGTKGADAPCLKSLVSRYIAESGQSSHAYSPKSLYHVSHVYLRPRQLDLVSGPPADELVRSQARELRNGGASGGTEHAESLNGETRMDEVSGSDAL
jgi:hypothetical protein